MEARLGIISLFVYAGSYIERGGNNESTCIKNAKILGENNKNNIKNELKVHKGFYGFKIT